MAWTVERPNGVYVCWREGSGRKAKQRKRKVEDRTLAEEVILGLQAHEEQQQDARGLWDGRGGPCLIGELAEAWVSSYGSLRSERTQATDVGPSPESNSHHEE